MSEQPKASVQYQDYKKWPKTYREPTSEEWDKELSDLRTQLAEAQKEAFPAYKREKALRCKAEADNAALRATLAEKDREIDKYKLSVKNIDEHKVLHGEPRPMCSCGYTCKTDQGMETHLKSIRIQSELKDARIKINDLQRELNKCDCGVCNWCNGSTYYHSKQRAEKAEAELAEKVKEVERLKIDLDVANSMNRILNDPVKSPCGHSSRYAHTEDGGKHIYCYVCSAERAEKAEADNADLRNRLKPVEKVCKKWDKKGDRELLHRPRLLAQELWQAIEAACKGK